MSLKHGILIEPGSFPKHHIGTGPPSWKLSRGLRNWEAGTAAAHKNITPLLPKSGSHCDSLGSPNQVASVIHTTQWILYDLPLTSFNSCTFKHLIGRVQPAFSMLSIGSTEHSFLFSSLPTIERCNRYWLSQFTESAMKSFTECGF